MEIRLMSKEPGVSVDGTVATITASGNYRLSGSLDDGQIVVNCE
ncbi:MAG: carbohydrate-binding domain-containing protein [Cyclobacteriaceae bacterium]|nr:carbohydrate-binding domain-containing protein [Cyclobacteriaceae bacterium]